MRALIQKVSRAAVSVDGQEISRIGAGFLVLLAVKIGDTELQAKKMADKIAKLRIIDDGTGKLNLSLLDTKQAILLVSQFTLYGDSDRGNRPSFIDSARPEQAKPLFELVAAELRASGLELQTGSFGAYMQIDLTNDGPTTLMLEI
jgi:D-tyrosyl-tRNA(Tyr) deacylase